MRRVQWGASERRKFHEKKFGVGLNPLEQEAKLDVIQPRTADQQKQMIDIIDRMLGNAPTQAERNALEMWRMQLISSNAEDQVKYDFMRRFYFWLLGRGTDSDTDKTFWKRGNAAAHNPEVAAYIDQFTQKRAQYAMQLSLLASRVPSSLNGYYLYFKYIVNGRLKQGKDKNTGESWYYLDQDDFLQDFDMFQQEFERGVPGYAPLISAQEKRPRNVAALDQAEPYPFTQQQREETKLDAQEMVRENVEVLQESTNQPPERNAFTREPRDPARAPEDVTGGPQPGLPTNAPAPTGNFDAFNAAAAQLAAVATQQTELLRQMQQQQEQQARLGAFRMPESPGGPFGGGWGDGPSGPSPPPPPAGGAAPAISVQIPGESPEQQAQREQRETQRMQELRTGLEEFHRLGRQEMANFLAQSHNAQMERLGVLGKEMLSQLQASNQLSATAAANLQKSMDANTSAVKDFVKAGVEARAHKPHEAILDDVKAYRERADAQADEIAELKAQRAAEQARMQARIDALNAQAQAQVNSLAAQMKASLAQAETRAAAQVAEAQNKAAAAAQMAKVAKEDSALTVQRMQSAMREQLDALSAKQLEEMTAMSAQMAAQEGQQAFQRAQMRDTHALMQRLAEAAKNPTMNVEQILQSDPVAAELRRKFQEGRYQAEVEFQDVLDDYKAAAVHFEEEAAQKQQRVTELEEELESTEKTLDRTQRQTDMKDDQLRGALSAARQAVMRANENRERYRKMRRALREYVKQTEGKGKEEAEEDADTEELEYEAEEAPAPPKPAMEEVTEEVQADEDVKPAEGKRTAPKGIDLSAQQQKELMNYVNHVANSIRKLTKANRRLEKSGKATAATNAEIARDTLGEIRGLVGKLATQVEGAGGKVPEYILNPDLTEVKHPISHWVELIMKHFKTRKFEKLVEGKTIVQEQPAAKRKAVK